MTIDRDPHGNETRFLHQLGSLAGAHVLEVGCGEGRMTWRYAEVAKSIVAIDPDLERLAAAHQTCTAARHHRTHFLLADAENLPLRRGEFDRAILAWSL